MKDGGILSLMSMELKGGPNIIRSFRKLQIMKGEICLGTDSICKVLRSAELLLLLLFGKCMHEAKKLCSARIFFQIGLSGGSRHLHTKDSKKKYVLKSLWRDCITAPWLSLL